MIKSIFAFNKFFEVRTIFDWLDFKEVGDELSKNENEAFIRSAITRYYYAIFSAVREYLIYFKHQYQFINNWKIHERVWKFLLSSNDNNENEVGEFLSNLRHVRNSADYDKEHDYDYFVDKLIEVHNEIGDVVNSIRYLRKNPSRW